jgi:hypothetical protein
MSVRSVASRPVGRGAAQVSAASVDPLDRGYGVEPDVVTPDSRAPEAPHDGNMQAVPGR